MVSKWIEEFGAEKSDIIEGKNCISPACLEASLSLSLKNLNLPTIDLLYLHNSAEKHVPNIGLEGYYEKLAASFEYLERKRDEGVIRYYGLATWRCFRSPPSQTKAYVSLERVVQIAKEARNRVNKGKHVGEGAHAGPMHREGEDHGFKFVQLPINPTLPEAFEEKSWQEVDGEKMSILRAAHKVSCLFPSLV